MKRILITDDNAENRYMLEALLKGNGYATESAKNGAEALEIAKRNPPDIIVTDILMPVMDGFALCRQWKADEQLKKIPFVFYTATYTDPKDEQFALSLGADRFVMKPKMPEEIINLLHEILDNPISLKPSVQPTAGDRDFFESHNAALVRKLGKKMAQLEEANEVMRLEIAERKRVESELVYRNTILATQQEASLDAILVVDDKGRMVTYNRRFVELWGLPPDIADKRSDQESLEFVLGKIVDPEKFMEKVKYLYAHPQEKSRDLIELKDRRILDRYSAGIIGEDGHYYGRVWYFRDITEQRKLEEQLSQAQKMEAVGSLAGGIAHDFNNILSAIIGYGSILRVKMKDERDLCHYVEEILAASERAANLTQSMLAFSRKQVIELKPVDINDLIRRIQKMLSRLIREDIEFTIKDLPEPLIVRADAGQLEHMLVNLLTNGRDAMPHGGKLTISTEKFIQPSDGNEMKKGVYGVITVSDTGCGIDKEIRDRIFEPFFTTKEIGKGTGLGLAIVYGIVKKHDGFIHVYSEPGSGTAFKIFLPLTYQPLPDVREEKDKLLPSGTETLLLVEDNDNVRLATTAMLREFGYTVVVAADGEEAIRLFKEHGDRVSLVLCDLIMPNKSGKETYEEIRKMRPDAKAIFMSGYTADIISQKGLLEEGINFLSKPVSMIDLIRKVREVLDS